MISIGLPAFKSEFLAEAIKSVLNQSYPDFELIIVNSQWDEKIRSIKALFGDDRIRYYEDKSFPSMVDNWNKVLSYATGEYFILFSDDDLYDPFFLEEMVRLADQYRSASIFHCRVKQITSGNELISLSPLCPEYETGLSFIQNRLKGNRVQFAPEFMCKTEKLREIGGFVTMPLAWGTDDLTWFQLALEGGIRYSSKPLFSWRRAEQQVSTAGSMYERLTGVEMYQEWIETFLKTYKPREKDDPEILNDIKSTYPENLGKQKDFILNSGNYPFMDHLYFFFKYRKRFKLEIKWFLYFVYRKLIRKPCP